MEPRLNRSQFILRIIITVAVVVAAWFALKPVLSALNNTMLVITIYLYALIAQIAFVILAIARFRDIGRSGWWSLLLFVPYLNLLVILVLALLKGMDQDNDSGEVPDTA
jgi:uncharacterized membrane protein YhaH (DUF805 family)